MTVYILKFDRPLGNPAQPRGQATYYIGYCSFERFSERMKEHLSGNGAAITRAAVERGIGFRVVAKLWGSRQLERRLKNYKNTPLLVRKLQKEGRLLGMAPLTSNQQAIISALLNNPQYEAPADSRFDGRSLHGLIRRGLVLRWQDGTIQLSQSGLIAVTGEL